MKKALTIVLALCMILAICPFTVAAADPTGTPITTEEEFLAMKPEGHYYLANDLNLTKSYEQLFTGVFDGNDKTVTLNGEAMFWEFCGQAKNLTINGEVVATHEKDNGYWARGAFACMASGEGTIILYNIVNNANVTGFTEQDSSYGALLGNAYTGGIVGAFDNHSVGTTASFLIVDCVNNGNVKGYHCTGGISGILYLDDSYYSGEQTINVVNCTNNGNIEGLSTYTGGLFGRVYYCVDAQFTGCINNGTVKGAGNTGGIIGHTTNTSSIIRVCQNNGEISNITIEGETPYAGGIIGYAQGTKSDQFSALDGKYANQIEFCINKGKVTGNCRTGGIVGSSGASGAYGLTHTRYCINLADVTCVGLGASHAANGAGGIQGYGYGSSNGGEYAYVTDCITTGNVEAKNAELGIAAYFLAYISSANAVVARNSATGSLTSAADKAYCIGWDNAAEFHADTTGNLLLASNNYKIAAENQVESTKDFACGVVDEASMLSGDTIAAFNAAYKQITGATTDCMTQTIDGSFNPDIVVLEAAEPEFPAAPEPGEETTAPEETTKAPDNEETTKASEPTETTKAPDNEEATNAPGTEAPTTDKAEEKKGCGGFVAGSVAIIAILGTALIIKKRD